MKKSFLFISIYFITVISVLFIINYSQKKQLENIKSIQLKEHKLIYSIISNRIEKETNNIFNLLIENNQKTKELFSQRKREELYNHLKINFQNIKENSGYDIIHFHLPDNKTFLRMHNKDRFGDDLTDLRYSVNYVNEFKKKVSGLEVGRTKTSYRFVFPVFHDNNYIGSVEISHSLTDLLIEMEETYNLHGQFLIKQNIFKDKELFKNSLQKYYDQSEFNENYLKIKSIKDTHLSELET